MADLVRAYFGEHAASWNLEPHHLRVEYVPNPGGFGAMNFAVGNDHFVYHVKFAGSRGLLPWIRTASLLAARYRAPRLLAQIEVDRRVGAVFERLPGQTPAQTIAHGTLDEIVSMLQGLHADSELASILGGGPVPSRQTLLGYHIPMCEEDLDEIEPHLPLPFVDKTTGDWMRAETNVLRELVRHPAFDEPVSSPIHGDLWFGNVLVNQGSWWIIDWDDLTIGDPAHDLSLLVFTELDHPGAANRWLAGRDAAFIQRFEIYARAALLTFVIDPLADWIEAEAFPEVTDSARVHREALHRWAVDRYRRLYVRW